MSSIINQFSFILAAIIVLVTAAMILFRRGFNKKRAYFLAGLAFLLITGWLYFRPIASPISDPEVVRAQIMAGEPVLIEFQSPY